MLLYLFIFTCPFLLYIGMGNQRNRNVIPLALFLLFLSLFVGFSDMFGGYDRYIYGEVFDSIADITTKHGSYVDSGSFLFFNGEYGYTVLNIIISFYTANRYIFILSITLIIYLMLFIDLKRYTENYPFALILFMGLWFFFSFTYLRQVLGATVAWLGVKYVIERKPIKFFVVCLIAFSLHNSAIIFLPLYFVPRRKFSVSFVVFIMIAALILGLTSLPNALFSTYDQASAFERVNDYNATDAFRVEYLLEAIFFLFIILTNYRYIPKTNTHIVLLNMALIFCALLLFFIRSDNGGRISWYYIIGLIATITTITVNRKSIAIPMFLVLICLILYIRVYTSWQNTLNLYPYKTFFTNGYREGDYSWTYYEYDHDYDINKLYRDVFRWKPNP